MRLAVEYKEQLLAEKEQSQQKKQKKTSWGIFGYVYGAIFGTNE